MTSEANNVDEHILDPKVVRCAIYARCATDVPVEAPNSIAGQIRACTEYAEREGWEIAREFVQSDIPASGVSLAACESLAHLLEASTKEPRPFDCVLVSDISRLSRSVERVVKLVGAFRARGVFVQAVHGQLGSRMIAALDENFINRIRQYLRREGQHCPICGR